MIQDLKEIFEEKTINYQGKELTFIKKNTILDSQNIILSVQIFLKGNLLRPVLRQELPDNLIKDLMLPINWKKLDEITELQKELEKLKENFFENITKKDYFVSEINSLFFGLVEANNINFLYQLIGLKVNEFGKALGNITLTFPELSLIFASLVNQNPIYKEYLYLLDNNLFLIPITYQNKTICYVCKYNKDCFKVLNSFTLFKQNLKNNYDIIFDSNDKRFLILDDKKFQKEMRKKTKILEGVK